MEILEKLPDVTLFGGNDGGARNREFDCRKCRRSHRVCSTHPGGRGQRADRDGFGEYRSKCGCEVVGPAATVKQAIEQIRRGPIDIAIVDYLLEDGTADRLARALDQRKIPFALCTGSDGGQLNVKFAGTPIVTKPYTQADIQGVIDTLVANRLADS
jgi:hypothetical protein